MPGSWTLWSVHSGAALGMSARPRSAICANRRSRFGIGSGILVLRLCSVSHLHRHRVRAAGQQRVAGHFDALAGFRPVAPKDEALNVVNLLDALDEQVEVGGGEVAPE